ncbi:MAG: hypothetical protein LDL44_03630 [Caenispirillum sp.]|nr:hypothetical protein [Caenispirillum sp.]
MAGLLAYAAAGGLAGLGKGLADETEARRLEAREELRARLAAEEAERNRRHQTAERVAGESFRAGQGDLDREQRRALVGEEHSFRADEAAKAREHQSKERNAAERARAREAETDRGDYGTPFAGADGLMWQTNRRGETLPVVDRQTGQQIKAAPKETGSARSPTPAERRTAIDSALREATAKDELGRETVNWDAYATALAARNIDIDDALRKQIEAGLKRQTAPEVKAEADKRDGWLSKGFGGGTRAEWEAKELDRRVAERLQKIVGAASRGGASDALPQVKTRAEYDALPSGARYIDPEGVERTKR